MPEESEGAGHVKTPAQPVPLIQGFFHTPTSTVSYVLEDSPSRRCAIIDPVLDYEPRAARTGTQFADTIIDHVKSRDLRVDWILETHAHADHLSAAGYLRGRLDAPVGIGEHIRLVQNAMKRLFNLGHEFLTDGSQFDRLFSDGERLRIGATELQVLHTPGHTPACVSYVTDGLALVGDTLFMPDYGTARADFPGGSARALYRSIRRLLALPGDTVLYSCHDYPPGGRPPRWQATVAEQRQGNVHIHDGVSEEDFVRMREARDRTLELPALILPALQINIRAGRLPPAESNGVSYLKIPLDVFR
jgi:glyoxylase-like metal-dependent hydrolase (beta-lactamase superfamily II)